MSRAVAALKFSLPVGQISELADHWVVIANDKEGTYVKFSSKEYAVYIIEETLKRVKGE